MKISKRILKKPFSTVNYSYFQILPGVISRFSRLLKVFFFNSRHKAEARAAGISDVIDLELPDDDELERDLILLAKEQEKLLAELTKAYAEESERERDEIESGRRDAFDREMEARLKGMKLSLAPDEIEGAMDEVKKVGSLSGPSRELISRLVPSLFQTSLLAYSKHHSIL